MEGTHEVRVGYTPVAGTILLILALLNIVLGVMAHSAVSTGLGALFIVMAILQLTMPYFVLTEGELQLRNLFGMTVKRYAFDDLSQFEIAEEGKRIFLTTPNGDRKRVRVTRWISQRGAWERFITALNARAFD
ncbi:MAG: hypothetical protein CVU56_05075 [Deltaproteobacteria bacterium HGW-Deltaproteobacteria-14]|jgi:hypothetical protein|nr:MAG: hypothetical protein CVU56_05075 [Deltaproteobacteria bacterium HGW-Deltaproteobacteria-14]